MVETEVLSKKTVKHPDANPAVSGASSETHESENRLTFKVAALTHPGSRQKQNDDSFLAVTATDVQIHLAHSARPTSNDRNTSEFSYSVGDAAVTSEPRRRTPSLESAPFSPSDFANQQKLAAARMRASGVEGFFAVADGMGIGSGDLASKWTITFLISEMVTKDWGRLPRKKVVSQLGQAIQSTNRLVFTFGRGDAMTTLTMALVVNGRLISANVGDSRTYGFNHRTRRLTQLSHDYARRLTQRSASVMTPGGNSYPVALALDRWLGYEPTVPMEVTDHGVITGRRTLLLCSDGLWGAVSDGEMSDILGRSPTPRKSVQSLVQHALEYGGKDNTTAMVVEITPNNT